jgi:sugar/nucleoside kinase (ribokinase family)
MIGMLGDLAAGSLDGIIFTDFGCGTVTISLLTEAMARMRGKVGVITGDVSGARRTMLAMRHADLLTPTERELRSVLGDFDQSLPTLAHRIMHELRLANLAVTMGRRGAVLFRPRESDPAKWFNARLRSEYLPALAPYAVDPVGAGDAFLAAATLTLTTGASLMQAGYVGSAASAIAVSRLGNEPVTRDQLMNWLTSRGELADAAPATRTVA